MLKPISDCYSSGKVTNWSFESSVILMMVLQVKYTILMGREKVKITTKPGLFFRLKIRKIGFLLLIKSTEITFSLKITFSYLVGSKSIQ